MDSNHLRFSSEIYIFSKSKKLFSKKEGLLEAGGGGCLFEVESGGLYREFTASVLWKTTEMDHFSRLKILLHLKLRLLNDVKDRDKPEDRQRAVYKIKCCDWHVTFIGETSRKLSTHLTDHKRVTRNDDVNNDIAERYLQTKHHIDWDSATCITCSIDYYQRLTLESWFTNCLDPLLSNLGYSVALSRVPKARAL